MFWQTNNNHKKKQGRFLLLICLAIAFNLAYTQSPLFTSNQNQYFLHGMALAGYGNLDEDWLAVLTLSSVPNGPLGRNEPEPIERRPVFFEQRFEGVFLARGNAIDTQHPNRPRIAQRSSLPGTNI